MLFNVLEDSGTFREKLLAPKKYINNNERVDGFTG